MQSQLLMLWAQVKAMVAAGASANFADSEVPGGALDGANKTFSLLHPPIAGTLKLYLSGVRTTAFALVGNTITMNAAPKATTSSFLADYRYP